MEYTKTKLKIRKGDIVKIIAGESKGKQGKVLTVFTEKNRALVEGANQVSKHTKPSAKKHTRWNCKAGSICTYQ